MSITPCLAKRTGNYPGGLREMSFVEEFCLPFLLRAQNADGGWGYMPGFASGVEPTSWALLALCGAPAGDALGHAVALGRLWLRRAQLQDGSWPAFVGQHEGCWATALACLALKDQQESRDSVARGVRWLCDVWPADHALWWRLASRLRRGPAISRQESSLHGWGWTSGTASWVEPTSCSLILLKALHRELLPLSSAKRMRLAEAMLYDRICQRGGWNAGNPMVYAVAGIPSVIPTAWALLALLEHHDRPENRKSLNWLASAFPEIQGPGSLALAHLCLHAHGRVAPVNRNAKFETGNSSPTLEDSFRRQHALNEFLLNIVVVAWATIALKGVPDWVTKIDA